MTFTITADWGDANLSGNAYFVPTPAGTSVSARIAAGTLTAVLPSSTAGVEQYTVSFSGVSAGGSFGMIHPIAFQAFVDGGSWDLIAMAGTQLEPDLSASPGQDTTLTINSSQISDASAIGVELLTVVSQADAQAIIGTSGGGGGGSYTAGTDLTLTGSAFSLSSGAQADLALAASALQSITPGTDIAVSGNTVGLSSGAQTTLALAGTAVQPGGALGTPSSGTLTNCTFPTLNQNTTGSAASLSATLPVNKGGTGAVTLTGLVKGSGTSALTPAVSGTDYSPPLTAGTDISIVGNAISLSTAAQAAITSTSALAELRKVYPSATAPTLTCVQNITNSQILTSTAIGTALTDVIALGQVSIFDGCNMQHPTGSYPYTVSYRPYCSQQDANGDTYKATGYSLGFYSDSPEVEIAYVNRGSTTYRVWVDDLAIGSLTPATSTTTGSLESVLINFGTSKPRRYRVDLTGADLMGVVVSSVEYNLWPAEQRGPTVFFMGDSLTGGSSESTSYGAQIPEYVGNVLGWDNVWNCGIGGTGYTVADAPASFNNAALAQITYLAPSTATPSLTAPGSSLPTPDVVVCSWGYNDTMNSTTYTAAGVALATAREQWPTAYILLMSPIGPGNVGTGFNTGLAAIFTAAGGSPNATLSVWTGADAPWMTGTGNTGAPAGNGNSDIYTGADATHWTDAGIAYMGQRLAPKLFSLYASWDAKRTTAGSTGMVAPVQTTTQGAETYVITSGSVTQLTGITAINGYTPSIGDRVLVPTAPASSGVGTGFNLTSHPANGVYIVTGNTTNITLARAPDMCGSVNPGGLSLYVENGTWQAGGIFTCTTPASAAAFTYGSGNIAYAGTSGTSPSFASVFINNTTASLGIFNGTNTVNIQPTANSSAATVTLPPVTGTIPVQALTSTVTSGTTITLTLASSTTQLLTGATAQAMKLPTTGVVAGQKYEVINNSTATATISASGGGTAIGTLATLTSGIFTALQATPTANTHWFQK